MEVDHKTALQALFKLSVDTNLEFIRDQTKAGPLFTVTVLARREAIQALKNLVHVDPDNKEDIRKLQNEVQRFLDLVTFIQNIYREGDEAAQMLSEEEADEARDIVAAEDGNSGDDQ